MHGARVHRTRIAVSSTALAGPGKVKPGHVRAPNVTATSLILDVNGNPYRKPRDPLGPKDKPYASQVFHDLPITSLEHEWTPAEIRLALVEHALGLFSRSALLIDAIIGDDRVQSALGSRVGALLGLAEIIDPAPADTDGACADAWRAAWPACHSPPEQGDALNDILTVRLMGGIHVSEIVWDTEHESGYWQPHLKPWSLQHIYLDMGRRCLMAITENGVEQVIPGNGRWFVHAPNGIHRGHMNGLVRSLALPWLLRCLARRDWARYSERHGMPMIKAIVPSVADADDKKRFEDELDTMGTEAVIVLPQGLDGEGFDVDLLEAAAQSWEGFDRLIVRCESAITLAVQWQNLTTEVKEGSQAAARVHADVKQSAVMLDDRSLADDVQWQIARPFALWNFGNAKKAPRTRRDVEVLEDQVASLQALEAFGRACAALRTANIPFDVAALAKAYRIKLALATQIANKPAIFGYHLEAGIIRRDEMRARLELDAVGGEEGAAFIGGQPAAPALPAAAAEPVAEGTES